jgi:hypothetical protein
VFVSPFGSGTEVSGSSPDASGHGVVTPGASWSCPGSKSCSVADSEAPGCCPGSSDCGVDAAGPEVLGGWPDAACCFVVATEVTGSCPNSLGDPESSKLSPPCSLGTIIFAFRFPGRPLITHFAAAFILNHVNNQF